MDEPDFEELQWIADNADEQMFVDEYEMSFNDDPGNDGHESVKFPSKEFDDCKKRLWPEIESFIHEKNNSFDSPKRSKHDDYDSCNNFNQDVSEISNIDSVFAKISKTSVHDTHIKPIMEVKAFKSYASNNSNRLKAYLTKTNLKDSNLSETVQPPANSPSIEINKILSLNPHPHPHDKNELHQVCNSFVSLNEIFAESKQREHDSLPFRNVAGVEGDSFCITAPGGERVYARLREEDHFENSANNFRIFREKQLLSEPIHLMMERIESERFKRAIQEESNNHETSNHSENNLKDDKNEKLWVDKYCPHTFTELLSDEHLNREVLKWLKQWDPCVFGHKIISTSENVFSILKKKSNNVNSQTKSGKKIQSNSFFHKIQNAFQQKNRFTNTNKEKFAEKNKNWNKNEKSDFVSKNVSFKKESSDRPEQKVILLSGPPGLGKTTLAHVIAKHCGYRFIEINASDDRVSNTLMTRVLNAIQIKSVFSDNKPNCVIIDEIDGAFGGNQANNAIHALTELILSEKKVESKDQDNEMNANDFNNDDDDNDDDDNGNNNSTSVSNKKKSKTRKNIKVQKISRPIICICNDLYAPCLRPLRQIAKIIVFSPPSVNRIVNRLSYICEEENFEVSNSFLTHLANLTECDIRCCLHTLQFLNSKKLTLNQNELSSQIIYKKDKSHDLFEIWNTVFPKIGMDSKLKSSATHQNKLNKNKILMFDSLLNNFGSIDIVILGIFHNYLNIRFHDSFLQKTVNCLNWMSMSQIFESKIHSHQKYFLASYQNASIIAIHMNAISQQIDYNNLKIEFPKALFNKQSEQKQKKEKLFCLFQEFDITVQRSLSLSNFILDYISPLYRILLTPSIRPVSPHLLSEKEKEEIMNIVNIMHSFGLNYKLNPSSYPPFADANENKNENENENKIIRQKWSETRQISANALQIHPPIQNFLSYHGYNLEVKEHSNPIKQMIYQKLETEKAKKGKPNSENMRISSIENERITKKRDENNSKKSYNTSAQNTLPSLAPTKVAAGHDVAEPYASRIDLQRNVNINHAKGQGQSTQVEKIMYSGIRKFFSSQKGKGTPREAVGRNEILSELKKEKKGKEKVDEFMAVHAKPPLPKMAMDVFQRFKHANSSSSILDQEKTAHRDSLLVIYKYHEGFTNAVRRPLFMKDLL